VGGKPRLGAVAVGPLAHARALSALTRGSGPLFSIVDSSDATAVATALVSEALRPAFSNVELLLGPGVEQVYPRGARSALAGSTIEAVGRVRAQSPYQIKLRWRDKSGVHEEQRLVSKKPAPRPDDIRRRWAQARIDEVLLSRRGRETATDVALAAKLITPWTGMIGLGRTTYAGTILESRQLDVAVGDVETLSATLFGADRTMRWEPWSAFRMQADAQRATKRRRSRRCGGAAFDPRQHAVAAAYQIPMPPQPERQRGHALHR
jgi:hypothetical protein